MSDLSRFGAFIDDASEVPGRGDLVTLRFEDYSESELVLYGWVTRHQSRGFAIEFDELEPEVLRLVEDLAALVGRAS